MRSAPRPKIIARVAAILVLIVLVTAVFAQEFVSNRLINFSDATVTANNILANRSLFQISFTAYLIEMTSKIASIALFYVLLSPVNRTVAIVAAFIDLAGSVIKTMSRLFYITPLFVLSGATALNAFNTDQLRALALVLLKLNDRGAALPAGLLGLSGLLNGYLIFRSTFLPRTLGILSMLSSVGWLRFFYPPLRFPPFMFIAVFSLAVGALQIFWFVVFGVDEDRWKETYRVSVAA